MPPDDTATIEKPSPPSEVGHEETPGAPPGAAIEDVYGDFDAADRAENAPPKPAPKKESGKAAPKPVSRPAGSAEKQSGEDGGEDTSKKPAGSSASSAGSDAGKDKSFKTLSDEEYAKLDKPARVAFNAGLREQYAKASSRVKALEADLEKARTTSSDGNRVKELQELLNARDARLKEVEDHLRMTAYERSEEFKDKYQKPYLSAYTAGRNKAASLKLVQRLNPDTDEIVQQARQGTAEDFDAIMRIADDDAAYELADRMFGPKALAVMHYRERVQELHQQSREAIEERRTKAEAFEKEAAERQKQQAEQTEAQSRERAALLAKHISDGMKAHPDWFETAEGDEEAPKVIEAGKAIADSLFTGVNPKTGKPYTNDGMIRFHAFVRNAIAAHGPLLHRLNASKARIADLEAQLAEFKESSTIEDAGRRGNEGSPTDSLPGDEEFQEIDRRSR